jgi:hypothetical protein
MNKLALATLLLGLAGCAAAPKETATSPGPHVLMPGMAQPAASAKASASGAAGACSYRLSIDRQPFADVNAGEEIRLRTPPGEHLLAARGNGACPGGDGGAFTSMPTGRAHAFRVSVSPAGEIDIEQSAF